MQITVDDPVGFRVAGEFLNGIAQYGRVAVEVCEIEVSKTLINAIFNKYDCFFTGISALVNEVEIKVEERSHFFHREQGAFVIGIRALDACTCPQALVQVKEEAGAFVPGAFT